MKKSLFLSLFILLSGAVYSQTGVSPDSIAGIKGYWKFDDTSNVTHATFGTDLTSAGYVQSVYGSSTADRAVRLGVGGYFHCFHNIPANGSGSPTQVNNYTLLFDFKINQFGMWRSFYQTDPSNGIANDAEVFINPAGNIGVSATGYSQYSLKADEWYRLVISVSLGNHFDYYLDGQLLFSGTSQVADGRFALYPSTGQNEFLLFADNDGEDNIMDISQVAIYGTDLNVAQIDSLGGYEHNVTTTQKGINVYLQTPTPTSLYVSWHSTQTSGTSLQYGITSALGLTATGSYEAIGTKIWHTVKLNGLVPNTHYYYRCISGTDTSQIYEFRTQFEQSIPGKHLRFAILGDSQSNINMPALVSNAMEDKFKELYGQHWIDSVSLIIRTGDMVGDGSTLALYENEYFSPFGNLTRSIPSMISIGNHEAENNYYYQYMKYDDFSDFSYPDPLTERYYSFKIANCRFIAMNSNTSYQNTAQTDWLHNKLEQSNADPYTDFVFTYNHHPGHSEMWPDGNTDYSENTIYSELANFPKVMLNTYGHSHNYERGVFISTHGQPQDFRLMCVGGAGATLDRIGMYANQTDYPEIQSMYDYYSYVIIDVDVDNKSYVATTYSLGNPDKRMNNVPIETWHYYANCPAPEKPLALVPANTATVTPTLIASAFQGEDSLMSSQFQVTSIPGNWVSPVLDTIRDFTDIYGDSGAPNYFPTDINLGIDLQRVHLPGGMLSVGNTYFWRIRYRDQNIKWSDWSDPVSFTVVAAINDSADFIADTTIGDAPLEVHFTDLSVVNPTSWEWDFTNDGTIESTLQDPVYTYTVPGLYNVKLTTYFGVPFQSEIKNSYINVLNTGIKENDLNSSICYPNPFSDKTTISLSNQFYGKNISVEIYNCMGVLVEELFKGVLYDNQSLQWDGNNAEGGVYYCRISSGNIIQNMKLVKIL